MSFTTRDGGTMTVPQAQDVPPWETMGRFIDRRPSLPAVGARASSSSSMSSHFQGLRPFRGNQSQTSGLTRRGVIYEYIRGHPGFHVREMGRNLGVATGDMQYHLLWLEKNGYVKTKKVGFYRFVFPTMVFKEEEEVILAVLSLTTPRELLLSLLHDPYITQGELAERLGYSQPTVSWHIDRLIRLGLVVKHRASREGPATYEIMADHDDILKLVRSYHPGVWRRWAGRLSELVVSTEAKRDYKEEVGRRGRSPFERSRKSPPAVVELIGKH